MRVCGVFGCGGAGQRGGLKLGAVEVEAGWEFPSGIAYPHRAGCGVVGAHVVVGIRVRYSRRLGRGHSSMIPTRLAVLAVIGTSVATCVVSLVYLERTWNNPSRSEMKRELDVYYNNRQLRYTVSCICPSYLLSGYGINLEFKVDLIPDSTSGDAAAVSTHSSGGDVVQPVHASGISEANSMLDIGPKENGTWLKLADGLFNRPLANPSTRYFPTQQTLPVRLMPGDSPEVLSIVAGSWDMGSQRWLEEEAALVTFEFPVKATWFRSFSSYFLYAGLFLLILGCVFLVDNRIRATRKGQEARLAHAKELAEQNPERARFAWQLARTRLENYFDRNLFQVNLVFWAAIFVMAAGFGVVLWGVEGLIRAKAPKEVEYVTAAAGVVTQFLGATIMVLYKSTVQQANDYIKVLDRINNVGMAMQVLDQVPEEPAELKNHVRQEIILRLLAGSAEGTAGAAAGDS